MHPCLLSYIYVLKYSSIDCKSLKIKSKRNEKKISMITIIIIIIKKRKSSNRSKNLKKKETYERNLSIIENCSDFT